MSRRPTPRFLLEATGFCVAYVGLDWISYLQPIESSGITPWNPPPGLSLVALMRRGKRFAPVVLLAAFISEIVVRRAATGFEQSFVSAMVLAIGYGLLAESIKRRCQGEPDFHRLMDVSWFAGLVTVGVATIGAGYVSTLHLLGPPSAVYPGRQLLQFWVGDVIGILVLTPALCLQRRDSTRTPVGALETAAQAGLTAVLLGLLWAFDPANAPRLFYLLFLPLVWISIRSSIEGATVSLVAIQFGLILGLQWAGHTETMVLELQLLMLMLVFTGLFLGASVSEWRSTEQSLRERQIDLDETLRLAAASATASALAHELNQPLTAIASYLGATRTLLRQPVPDQGRIEKAIAAASDEAQRAGEVVRRLREFFRSGTKQLENISAERLTRDAVNSLRTAIRRYRISVLVDCPNDVGSVEVDRIQIESVLHQLLQNAIEAIDSVDLDRREIRVVVRRADGRITIDVSDSGPGIEIDLVDSIFSPFKTTKRLGTGLGLSICRAIVEEHGGTLKCSSATGGATFRMTLPSAHLRDEEVFQ